MRDGTATTSIAFCSQKDADIVETAYWNDLARYSVLHPETKKMIEDISLGRHVGPHAGEPDSYWRLTRVASRATRC